MPLSAHADSLFDTLIYRSLSRSHHAVPAPGENRRRDRVVRATGEDDAEVAGGAADHADGPRAPHARFPERDQRLRGRTTNVSRDQDDPPARRRPLGGRSKDGPKTLQTLRGIPGRPPVDARL